MKRCIAYFCLFTVFSLAGVSFGWPSGWPVTNAVPHWELYDGKHDLRTVVAVGLMRIPRDYRLPRTEDLLLSYAREHGIPISNMVSVAKAVAEEGFSMLESGSITNKEDEAAVMRYCGTLVGFMGYTKDPSALPYLEAKSVSTNTDVRQVASYGIMSIKGLSSIGFLRNISNNDVHKPRDLYELYESFGIKVKIEKEKNRVTSLDDAYKFLLELAEKEGAGDTVKMIDQVLCETLDGYSTSVQREKVAERMVRTGPDYSRPHFEAIRETVEKTPKEKRKDFRAHGELLDPDRKRKDGSP